MVPAKPANKAERCSGVGGDDGTKRNAELQSTVRTQGREAVTQAQDRIREVVNRNKKEKLTALLHHVSVDVLRWAFFNLKKQAAPGVDGLTWVDYAADADAVPLVGKQHPPRANGLRMRSLALSKTPCTWRSPLYGNWEISSPPEDGDA
jgi:hypothetical protein